MLDWLLPLNYELFINASFSCISRIHGLFASQYKTIQETTNKVILYPINSPKRQEYLIKNVKAQISQSNHHVLVNVCRTGCRYRCQDGMSRIFEMLLPVVLTLEDISLNRDSFDGQEWNRTSQDDAQDLVNGINFSLIVSLVVLKHI